MFARSRQFQAPGRLFPAIGTGHDIQPEFQVFDIPGHRSGNRQVGHCQGSRRTRNLPVGRHNAVARLVAGDTRHMRRQANRTADIAAEFQRREATGQSGARTTGRAARRARGVVRIIGRAENLIIALQVAGVDRQIGLAVDNGPGFAQAGHRPGVFLRDEIREFRRARCRPHPLGLIRILDRHGHAVQRPSGCSSGQLCIRGIGLCARPVRINRHHAVNGCIKRFDPGKKIVNGFTA